MPAEFASAFAAVRDRLPPLGDRISYFHTIGSTNDVALTLAAGIDNEGAVVIAEEQTKGRGRRGRAWFSPPLSGLYVSIVLKPSRARTDPERATGLLTLAAGVGLAEAIEEVTGLRAEIKWPNDVLVARRKLAGILAEGVGGDQSGRFADGARGGMMVVLGYGINVGLMSPPPDLADRVTSLESELGRPIDRAALCAETLAAISRCYQDLLSGRFDAILDRWRERAPTSRGARVMWNTSPVPQTGITAGIDDRGALLVRIGDRVERIVAGELAWL